MAPLSRIEITSIRISSRIALTSLIFAAVSLVGWLLDFPILYKYASRFPAMTLETIIGVVLGAFSIVVFNRAVYLSDGQEKFATRSAALLGSLLCLVGLGTIVFYLLYGKVMIYEGKPLPEELSSPRTSLAFAFLGLGTVVGAVSDRFRTYALLLLVIPFYTSIISLTGYVLAAASYYSVTASVGMSIPTSVSVILLTFAAATGPLRNAASGFLLAIGRGGEVARYLLPLTLILPAVTAWLVWSTHRGGFIDHNLAIVAMTVFPCFLLSLSVGTLATRLTKTERFSRNEAEARRKVEGDFKRYRALEHARARFEALVTSSADSIFCLDEEGNITFFNHSALILFGYDSDELTQRKFSDLIRTKDVAVFKSALTSAKNHQGINEYETCGIRKDGSEVDISLALSPIIQSDEPAQEISIIARDISDLKRNLRQKEAIADELQKANSAKEEFLAVLSHELRTPLNVILGYSDLLPELDFDSDEYKEALDAIKRNALAEAKLVEDILNMSSIVSGKLKIESAPFDVKSAIDQVVRSSELAMRAKQLEFELKIAPNLGKMEADEIRFRQILWNLLSNAIKFTEPGGKISVKAETIANTFVLEVSDTGKGLERHELSLIFNRFYQTDSSYTRQYPGLGIGLSLSKQLVEAHGGTIRAASLGKNMGAVFTVELPTQT